MKTDVKARLKDLQATLEAIASTVDREDLQSIPMAKLLLAIDKAASQLHKRLTDVKQAGPKA